MTIQKVYVVTTNFKDSGASFTNVAGVFTTMEKAEVERVRSEKFAREHLKKDYMQGFTCEIKIQEKILR